MAEQENEGATDAALATGSAVSGNLATREDLGPDILLAEHRLTHLLALSFDGPASPSFELRAVAGYERATPYGWGFAWYPEQGPCALVVKDPTSIGENALTKLLNEWERFESTTFVCHLRGAARSLQEQDTQPFARSYAGREWVFAHNGDLFGDFRGALPLGALPASGGSGGSEGVGGAAGPATAAVSFEPNGRSDSEHAFCWLLEQLRQAGARRFADLGYERLHGLLRRLDALGTVNLLVTDGVDLIAYRDGEGYNGLSWTRLLPPHDGTELLAPDLRIDLDDASVRTRTAIVVSTGALRGATWRALEPGQLLVVRRGAVVYDSSANLNASLNPTLNADFNANPPPSPSPAWSPPPRARPSRRRVRVTHETVYRYERPVERSEHVFRLRPVMDRTQQLLQHSLEVSVDGLRRDFEDVFGNQACSVELERSYTELRIASTSTVELLSTPSPDLHSPERRFTVPLVWMPWQAQMMTPYLLPPELPETQLNELYEYALSFVARQDDDLLQTLFDMNRSIRRDFSYVAGSTTIATTAFDVYASRRGVCQDFANLLICLARLLGIPARYRVGYIHTGNTFAHREQGDASHAWAELYLPWIGWQGFDPTNGCLATENDHVRVACGRNYRDATPTSGTIYKGGGPESLTVAVRVEELPLP